MQHKIALTLLVFVALLGANFARAQEQASPEIIISWKASGSYAPSFFEGKILPSKTSSLVAKLLVIENGQAVDLSQTEVRWYLNKRLIKSSLGLKEVSLSFNRLSANDNELSVTLRQYKGDDFSKSTALPTAHPKVFIDLSNLENIKDKGAVNLRAYPFFFSVADTIEILFSWRINQLNREGIGVVGTDLIVNLSSLVESTLNVELEAENMDNPFERASYKNSFTIK
jgi:hypothetical protein